MRVLPGQVPKQGMQRGSQSAGHGCTCAGDVRVQTGGDLRERLRADAQPQRAEDQRPLLCQSPEGAQQRAALQDAEPGQRAEETDHQSQQEGEVAAGATYSRARRAADDGAEISEEIHRVQREDRLPHQDRGVLLQGKCFVCLFVFSGGAHVTF